MQEDEIKKINLIKKILLKKQNLTKIERKNFKATLVTLNRKINPIERE
jgi:hypothetical protein